MLEIGAGKAGDIHKYARCLARLRRRHPTAAMQWCVVDPGYAAEASPLLREAQRRHAELPADSRRLLSLEPLALPMQEALWAPSVSGGDFTHVSAMLVLNYVLSSEEQARLHLQRIHDLLRPGGILSLCVTDSEALCGWEPGDDAAAAEPRVAIEGAPEEAWGSRYTPTVDGEGAGVTGLQEYVLPHRALVGVARRCGFEVLLDANHAALRDQLEAYRRCRGPRRAEVDRQMHLPRLYRAMVLRRPRRPKRRGGGGGGARAAKKKR